MTSKQRQMIQEDGLPHSSKTKRRKGHWSHEEDAKLLAYLIDKGMLGCCSWTCVAKLSGLQRCGKSCRLRWINYLRPGLKRGAFSEDEERLIINMQSNLGNRWSQIAAQMPGRTDNEIKNYWNASIKKKLKFKHRISSPSTQPYMNALPGRYQIPNNTVNVVTTGENQFSVPGIFELKLEQVQDQNDEPISNFQLWINDTSAHSHESVSSHAVFPGSAGMTIPDVSERECLKDKIENDRWITTVSYSNPDDWSTHVLDPGAYSGNEAGITTVEDNKSLYDETTLQSCSPLSFHSQFGTPAIKWPPDDFPVEDDRRDGVKLRYVVNLGVPNCIDIYSRQKNYPLPQIDGGGGIGDQREFSIRTPITTTLGSSGPFEIQCKSEAGQVTHGF